MRREQEIKTAEILRARATQEAQITKEREIEVANQDRQIIIAQKSQAESRVRASGDIARAEAAKPLESIETVRTVAQAERAREIAVIDARREAGVGGTKIRLAAEAERAADDDRAAALTIRAEIIAMRVVLAKIEAMPRIVAEMVKPAEKIDCIRINQISGMGGDTPGDGSARAPVNQAFDALPGAALHLPVMKKLGEEPGMNFDGGLACVLDDPAPKPKT